MKLTDHFQYGLNSPICLTWEFTYACNLACVHCLSSSGRRDPRELSTAECRAVVDELQKMQVFYVNIGGGEPTVRPDFWELLDYSIDHNVGVKFSTNGIKLDARRAAQLAGSDYVYDWLVARGEDVLTGDSFFHLSAYGESLPGLNLCGAGRVVCLIDPVGDVYACPFAIHEEFLAGNVRSPGGFETVWRSSELFAELRTPQTGGACRSCGHYDACQGGCMAAKFFTGLPLDGPDPECVLGNAEQALAARDASTVIPRSEVDHSRSAPARRGGPVPVSIGMGRPDRACDESPLAGMPVPVAGA